ncbi:MAG: hypothetical protein K2H43_02065, partial [Clostridia bacterium]|nr:hypothetical protein [Clostridia bacterium]
MKNIGYFDDKNREYVVTEMFPRRPLKNFLWNDGMITEVNQFGFGAGKACIDKDFRTVVSDYRLVYLKDGETGEIYDANRNFKNKPFSEFFARVGLGYQITESLYNGIRTRLTVLVPERDYAEMHRVTVKNETDGRKRFQLYYYVHPSVNLNCHDACGKAYADEKQNMLYFSFRTFPKVSDYSDIFLSADRKARAFELTEEAFFGTYGGVSDPCALRKESLSGALPSFEPAYAGVLQYSVELDAGEEQDFFFTVGTVRDRKEAERLAKTYTGGAAFQRELTALKAQAEELIRKTLIQTDDGYLNSMVNI